MDRQQIKLVTVTGEEATVEVILKFTIKEFNKEYMIYTKNEKDEDGNILLYSVMIVPDGDSYQTANIETEEEWTLIKDLIRKIAKGECE